MTEWILGAMVGLIIGLAIGIVIESGRKKLSKKERKIISWITAVLIILIFLEIVSTAVAV